MQARQGCDLTTVVAAGQEMDQYQTAVITTLDWIRYYYPFWDLYNGADHMWIFTQDHGYDELLLQLHSRKFDRPDHINSRILPVPSRTLEVSSLIFQFVSATIETALLRKQQIEATLQDGKHCGLLQIITDSTAIVHCLPAPVSKLSAAHKKEELLCCVFHSCLHDASKSNSPSLGHNSKKPLCPIE